MQLQIGVSEKTMIQLRDGEQCTYKDPSGRHCGSQRYLEIHHIKEVT